jgi:hypothetical protein
LNIESTQPASNLPEPVYQWFQVAWDIAQEKTGLSEHDLVANYIKIANKYKFKKPRIVVETNQLSRRAIVVNQLRARNEEAISLYSRRFMYTDLSTQIATALLERDLLGYTSKGELYGPINGAAFLKLSPKIFVRPTEVKKFLYDRGFNVYWNPNAKKVNIASSGTGGFSRPAIKTLDLARAFGGIERSEMEWRIILGKSPKWVSVALISKGSRGGKKNTQALWDPIQFAKILRNKFAIPLNKIRSQFRMNPLLKVWYQEWKLVEDDLIPDE